jgi:hypothetical protein
MLGASRRGDSVMPKAGSSAVKASDPGLCARARSPPLRVGYQERCTRIPRPIYVAPLAVRLGMG